MKIKPNFFWQPNSKSPEEMSDEDALNLKEATGDNAIELAIKGHVSTDDGEIYVVNNKCKLLQWP